MVSALESIGKHEEGYDKQEFEYQNKIDRAGERQQ